MLTSATLTAYDEAIRTGCGLRARSAHGSRITVVDMARFLGAADRTDLDLLDHCTGRVLDIGCGPGRITAALQQAGMPALGIDVAAEAVRSTRSRGGQALRRNVYGELPLEGHWDTALLVDGNIGIGGDPDRLLGRIRGLLAPGGRVIVETDADRACDRRDDLVLLDAAGRPCGSPFGWATVGRDVLAFRARSCGYRVAETWSADGRDFVLLLVDDRDDTDAVATLPAVG